MDWIQQIHLDAYKLYPVIKGPLDGKQCDDIYEPERNAYIQGAMDAMYHPKISGWVVKEKNSTTWFSTEKPYKIVEDGRFIRWEERDGSRSFTIDFSGTTFPKLEPGGELEVEMVLCESKYITK